MEEEKKKKRKRKKKKRRKRERKRERIKRKDVNVKRLSKENKTSRATPERVSVGKDQNGKAYA